MLAARIYTSVLTAYSSSRLTTSARRPNIFHIDTILFGLYIREVLIPAIYPLSPGPIQLFIRITHAMLIKFGNSILHIFFLNYFPTAHMAACFDQFGKFMQSQPLNEGCCQSVTWTESPPNFHSCSVTYKYFLIIFQLDKLGEKKSE